MVPVTPKKTTMKSLTAINSAKKVKISSPSGFQITTKLYYIDTKAKIQLVWAQQSQVKDGFTNDLHNAIKTTGHPIRVMGLVYGSYRRESKEINVGVTNFNESWHRMYFSRIIPKEITADIHIGPIELERRMKDCLLEVKDFFTDIEKTHALRRMSQASDRGKAIPAHGGVWNLYKVPDDFNRTPATGTKALDHYLLDDDIVIIVKMCFIVDNENWSTWGRDNPEVAKRYFSEPHPAIAIHELGYPPTFVQMEAEEAGVGII